LSPAKGIVFSLTFAALIAASAQFAFELPFTNVPVTLQVFTVLLAGGLLGARWGTLSVVEYLVAGAAGLPVFAQWKAGPVTLFGPTGGYLVGFALAALLVGLFTERRRTKGRTAAGLLLGIAVIWLLGALWQHFGMHMPWPMVLPTSVLPFIAVDLLKALAAWAVLTRTSRLTEE
jgi:biotin transport system substrate-specific component